ncbi:MAG TPA: BamA/TamA family outer membrane protein, partial [Gemmatimonadaceae bacterium]|nr:BamA/TamA family outer membrane protein [Gemmatimonadaceae bacterium]
GPTTVRGFSQNELGALIYIAKHFEKFASTDTLGNPDIVVLAATSDSGTFKRVVPVGGNSLVVGNLEMRLRSPFAPELLQWTLFTDAGEVWNRGARQVSEVKLKITPGIQVTAFSPVGPVRVAIGYNPYQRPAGPLYFEGTEFAGAPLLCVSPNNFFPTTFGTDPVTMLPTANQDLLGKSCPASYQPPVDNRFFKKLTFSFAIGQAF